MLTTGCLRDEARSGVAAHGPAPASAAPRSRGCGDRGGARQAAAGTARAEVATWRWPYLAAVDTRDTGIGCPQPSSAGMKILKDESFCSFFQMPLFFKKCKNAFLSCISIR